MAFPVHSVALPSSLGGQTNGKLDHSILISTPGQLGGPIVRLVDVAARAWQALAGTAEQEGIILKASGPFDSFRPYEVQEKIFLQRFTTTPLAGRPSRQWRGQTWYLKPGMALAAVPGTSNHGWGLAVDTGTELDGDAGTESIDQRTLDWLLRNAARFGFSWEVQSEPWHIRYFTGDNVPPAVRSWHGGAQPTPIPISGDSDMAGTYSRTVNPKDGTVFEAMIGLDSCVFIRSGNQLSVANATASKVGDQKFTEVMVYFSNDLLWLQAKAPDPAQGGNVFWYNAFRSDWTWSGWTASKNVLVAP